MTISVSKFFVLSILTLVSFGNLLAQPTISSFSPKNGQIGTSVNITGSNFSTSLADNIVFFGAVQATVSSASSTQIQITVPPGATYQPISVLVDGLIAYSSRPFIVTFNGTGFDENSFENVLEIESEEFVKYSDIDIGDFNLDGKIDLITVNKEGTISVFKNNTVFGGGIAFTPSIEYEFDKTTGSIVVGDFDGDGKLDFATDYYFYRNTTENNGSLSFALGQEFSTGAMSKKLEAGDFDGDGRADLIRINSEDKKISIWKNTSSEEGSMNFVSGEGDIVNESSVFIQDLNQDRKLELITLSRFSGSAMFVYKNVSSVPGVLKFDTPNEYATAIDPLSISSGDLNGDGKLDLAVVWASVNALVVYINTSEDNGDISFSDPKYFVTGDYPKFVTSGDLNGDGKLDLAVLNSNSKTVSIFQNLSHTPDNFELAPKIDFLVQSYLDAMAIADFDNDGKLDLATIGYTPNLRNIVTILRNNVNQTGIDILSFSLSSQIEKAFIDTDNHSVNVTVSREADVTNLLPSMSLSSGASITPEISTPQNFTEPFIYAITGPDGITTQNWTVAVTKAANNETEITVFSFPGQLRSTSIDAVNHDIDVLVPFNVDLTSNTPAISLSTEAAIFPMTNVSQDFTAPVIYTVTAEDEMNFQYWTVHATVANTATCITEFTLPDQTTEASIDSDLHIIDVEVAYGTYVSALSPTIIVSTGASISPTVGTAQDFTDPVIYAVTAEGGITTQDWTVDVTVASPNTLTDIIVFGLSGQANEAVIDNEDHTIDIVLVFGSSVTALTPTIEVSEGVSMSPSIGFSQDFTNPVVYTVTAEDGVTTQDWIVGVSVTANSATDITSFNLINQKGDASIDPINHTIDIELVYGSSLTALTPAIEISDGASLSPTIGVAKDFTSLVLYAVTAEDETTTQNWIIDVTVASPNTSTDIIAFGFVEQANEAVIDFENYTIDIELAYGSSLTAMTPIIEISEGASMSPTMDLAKDFTNSVIYNVTAEDEITTQNWTIDVTVVSPNTSTDIIAFDFVDQANEVVIDYENHTIDIELVYGSSLTAMIPTIEISEGASMSPTIGIAKDFTNLVIYNVTAEDAITSQDWTIDVTLASPNTSTDIIEFSLADQKNDAIIDFDIHTLDVEVVYGSSLTAMTPTIEISEGATMSPTMDLAKDFTSPVVYTVTAEDETTTQNWTIDVTVASPDASTDIIAFDFVDQANEVVIDYENHTIEIELAYGSSLTALNPTIEISEGASMSPTIGIAKDFTNPVVYTITSEDETTTQNWTIGVTVLSNKASILFFAFEEQNGDAAINFNDKSIVAEVPFGTNISSLLPSIIISDGASISPETNTAQDFRNGVVYTVISEDESFSQEWEVAVTFDDGLVAYYPFNGNANDQSNNNNHGTAYGASLSTDRFGNSDQAYSFDGLDDYVQIPADENNEFGKNDFTISIWVLSDASFGAILSKMGATDCNYPPFPHIILRSQKGGIIYHSVDNAFVRKGAISSTILDNSWHQATMTREGSFLRYYFDGELLFENSIDDNSDFSTPYDIYLGKTNLCTGLPYTGKIDDLRIYSRALTGTDIETLYADESGLLAHYPFNGNANDETGNGNTGVLNGASLAEDRFGNPNSAYSFDGADDEIEISSLNLSNKSFTVSFWEKVAPDHSNGAIFFGQGDEALKGKSIQTGYRPGEDIAYIDLYAASELEFFSPASGTWQHWTYTFDKSTLEWKMFLNGVMIEKGKANTKFEGRGSVYLGRSGLNFTSAFKGVLDDIWFYGRALSDAEISKIHKKEFGLIGLYTFNSNAKDQSGYSNNGQVFGATRGISRFNQNRCYDFDGVDDYINFGDKFNEGQVYTFSFWFQLDESVDSEVSYEIFSKRLTSDISEQSYSIIIPGEGEYKGQVLSRYYDGSGNSYGEASSGVVIEKSRWYHVATIVENGNTFMYINGVLASEKSGDFVLQNSSTDFILGNNASFTQPFFGSIDDLQVYNRRLSAFEISEIYAKESGLLADYAFNGNADDRSINRNDGTVQGATLTTDRFGNENSAYSFDGINDKIEAFQFFISAKLTFSVWIKNKRLPSGNSESFFGTSDLDHNKNGFLVGTDQNHHPIGETDHWVARVIYTKSNYSDFDLGSKETDKWYHLVYTYNQYDGTTEAVNKFYIDGKLVQSGIQYLNSQLPLSLGKMALKDEGFSNVDLDDIKIWNRALSKSEIKELYHEGGWPLPSAETDILGFTLPNQRGSESIDDISHRIEVEVDPETDITSMTPIITLSAGASISPLTNIALDFSGPITYIVTAENGNNLQTWTVDVEEVILNTATYFELFSFPDFESASNIDESNHSINVELLYGTDITSLKPSFIISDGAKVQVGLEEQISGITNNDYSNPVVYTVTAEDGITSQEWTVTVTLAPNTSADIMTFSFSGFDSDGIINVDSQTINIELPYGTDLSNLVPIFSLSEGASIFPGADITQDFTNSVTFNVTAEDNATIKDWIVVVTKTAPNTGADILSFAFKDLVSNVTINNVDDARIEVLVPYGTDISNLIPMVSISNGASISPNTSIAQDYTTLGVTYAVTSEDVKNIKGWLVTVTIASGTPPEIEDQGFQLPENSKKGEVIGEVAAFDQDDDELAYSIISGNELGPFIIEEQSGLLKVLDSSRLDFETNTFFTLKIQVSDGELISSADIKVILEDLNEIPEMEDQEFILPENSLTDIVVGELISSDPDMDEVIITIISGNESKTFGLDAQSGLLKVVNSTFLDFETTQSFTLTVQISDGQLTNSANIKINLEDLNETPQIENQEFVVAENAINEQVVGIIFASDPEGDEVSYSIISGNETEIFSLNPNTGQLLIIDSGKLNFEITPSFELGIQVGDGELISRGSVSIVLTNENDLPSEIEISQLTINENLPKGTPIGTLSTADEDVNDIHNYTLVSGSGDTDNSNFTINQLQLLSNNEYDFETKTNYFIRIETNDGNGGRYSKAFTIQINDLDDEVLGLNESFQNQIMFYPNPVSSILTITVLDTGDFEIKAVTDLNGKKINAPINRIKDALKIDLSTIDSGMYLILVQFKGKSYSVKIRKE